MKIQKYIRYILFIVILCLFSWPRDVLLAQSYIVTNTNNRDEGSLRWAIKQANAHFGADTIRFNIPDTDPGFEGNFWRICLQSSLTQIIDDSTVILGQSQEQNQGDRNLDGPDILIDGREMTEVHIGFIISSSENIISGLTISGCEKYGIRIRETTAINNRILGNYIGTDPTGSDTLGNGCGIFLSNESQGTIIGGTNINDQNVISGNMQDGICMTSSRNNLIVGNIIGADRTGMISVPNGRDGKHSGIFIGCNSNSTIVGGLTLAARNIISGNNRDGIQISDADSNHVMGNYIGPDITG